ncbi:hypothetical protein Gotur_021196 [Gossypium turneri]
MIWTWKTQGSLYSEELYASYIQKGSGGLSIYQEIKTCSGSSC